MPAALEAALKRGAAKKGYTGKRADRYVYGTLYDKGYPVGKDKHTKPGVTPKSEGGKKKKKKKAINPSNRYNIK
jgi:hypothetical protein